LRVRESQREGERERAPGRDGRERISEGQSRRGKATDEVHHCTISAHIVT